MGTSREDLSTFLITSRSFPRGMRNISDKCCRENQNTHFVFNYFFFANRAFFELVCKKIVQLGRLQMTTWRTPIACWVPKATNTHTHIHTGCVIFIVLPL